ncbi:acidic mammalian chitinase-like [Ischnura elegans]|uniref:acidic mammalian chitinase-like n=1 Tax=Ischnura elegans TaxID=197161 RepID=UPI001ED89E5B|nr:acidic mammalian chitinase-like [Ischnura elegans]
MKVLFSLLFGLILCLSIEGKATKRAASYNVVCYFSSWAGYRNGLGAFTPEDTDATICTHAVYAFAGLDEQTAHVKPLDPWNDLTDGGGKGFYNRFVALKNDNSDLKVLLGVGGWNEGSAKYSVMASSKTGRSRFITSVIELLKEHSFDGMDLAWLYPGNRGGSALDKKNYALLIAELREEFDKESLILTGTLPALYEIVHLGYDIDAVAKNLDFVNVLSYDLHGYWDQQTGLAAPLYYHDKRGIPDVNDTMTMYANLGLPKNKIVMGIPASAQTFALRSPEDAGIGADVSGPGEGGSYTQQPGYLGYNEIMESFSASPSDWTKNRDDTSQAPYAVNYLDWISYDDEVSIKKKADYIKDNGYAGGMIFTIDVDDFRGVNGGDTFPLVRTLYTELNG